MSRYYINAAEAVRACRNGKSFKGHFAARTAGKKEYAIAAETIKCMCLLQELMVAVNMNLEVMEIEDQDLLHVMMYELLFGSENSKIKGGGKVKRALMEYEGPLRREVKKMILAKGISYDVNQKLIPRDVLNQLIGCGGNELGSNLPRYIRINHMKCKYTESELLEKLRSEYNFEVEPDALIPGLYQLPASTRGLGECDLVKTGSVIIQDKASCIPSQLLCDEWIEHDKLNQKLDSLLYSGGDIIDACSAPGNKTSHMGSVLYDYCCKQNRVDHLPHINAFEKDPKRFKLLKSRMVDANAINRQPHDENDVQSDIISAKHADFLSIDVHDPKYRNVRYALLDPSCSGSGVSRAIERNMDDADSQEDAKRQMQLHAFQVLVTKKAMSFPNVHTILYSTCSVHQVENEDVVNEVLQWCRNHKSDDVSKHYGSWELKMPPRFSLDAWNRRGVMSSSDPDAIPGKTLTTKEKECLIRCLPVDEMNGFFVAVYTNAEKRNNNVTVSKPTAKAKVNGDEVTVMSSINPAGENKKRKCAQSESENGCGIDTASNARAKLPRGGFLNNMWKPKKRRR